MIKEFVIKIAKYRNSTHAMHVTKYRGALISDWKNLVKRFLSFIKRKNVFFKCWTNSFCPIEIVRLTLRDITSLVQQWLSLYYIMPLCNFNTVLPVAILLRARDKTNKISRQIKIEKESDVTSTSSFYQIRKPHYADVANTS